MHFPQSSAIRQAKVMELQNKAKIIPPTMKGTSMFRGTHTPAKHSIIGIEYYIFEAPRDLGFANVA